MAADSLPKKFKWFGTILVLGVILAVLALFAAGIWLSISVVSRGIGFYVSRVQTLWFSLMTWIRARNYPFEPADIDFYSLASQLLTYVRGGTLTVLSLLTILILILFLMVLMLIEEDKWRKKTRNAFGNNSAPLLETVGAISEKLRRFLLMHSLLSFSSGAATGLLLWLLDIDFAIVWGFLTFLLNFIPYIGSIIAAVPPILLALIQHGPLWALLVIGGLIFINLVNDNYLIPLVEGRALELSPLVVLIAVVYWGWVWGIAGAFLATPLTATLMVIFAQIPGLKPIALLMGGSTGEEETESAAKRDGRNGGG
jgi:predicted PurR-regulated permease PerM